ncbi:MAG: phage major capsid protein [Lysinibacillus sp.]
MTNPVLLGAKLQLKRSSLSTVEGKIADLLAKRSELESGLEGIDNEDDLALIEGQLTENENDLTAAESEKTTLESEIVELETQLEATRKKQPKNQTRSTEQGGKNGMGPEELKELRSAVNTFIRSKGQTQERDIEGFKVVDGGILVPEALLSAEYEVVDQVDLKQYVKVVPTKSGAGKYPVIKKSGSKMNTVAELAANPELAKPTVEEVDFSIETYRGYVPVSQEVIDDADFDIVGLIEDDIKDQEVNTRNAAIAAVMKTATAKTVNGLDDIITLFNTGFKTAYNVKVYASQSLFNEWDLLKYEDGRYVLQEDVTVPSGKRLKGKEIIVLDDEVIGTNAGDLVAFVGDAKAFAKFMDRKQVSVKWVDNEVYGQMLAAFVRFDVIKGDEGAGYYVTYTGTEQP